MIFSAVQVPHCAAFLFSQLYKSIYQPLDTIYTMHGIFKITFQYTMISKEGIPSIVGAECFFFQWVMLRNLDMTLHY